MTFFTNTYSIILLSFFVITVFLLPIITPSSAFRLGDADPLINNIWLEPKNPESGDIVSIHSSIYNQGTQSTKEVTNVVTVGYFIDGNLVKISPLTDVRPGLENGIEISTGPIWMATDGVHTVTVILNYHDTLSHISDNLENNIMQKQYYVGNWQNPSQPFLSFDLSQEAIPNTQNQIITINGKILLPENTSKYYAPRINLEFLDEKDNVHTFFTIVNDKTDSFYWRETIPVYSIITTITASLSDNRYSDYLYHYTQNLYPISLNQNESLFVLKFSNSTESNFKNQKFDVIIYDESYHLIKKYDTNQVYDYPVKEIETIQLPASPFKKNELIPQPNPVLSTNSNGDLLYIILPGDKMYNFEIYSENNLEYAALKFLEQNKILNDVIETTNTYNVHLHQNESLLSLKLSDPTNSHTFKNSEFDIVVFQDSYDNLFKQISTFGNNDLIYGHNEDLLTVLPGNHKYILEVYLDGKFLDAFETFLKNKDVFTKQISTPDFTPIKFEILDGFGNHLNDISVKNQDYSITDEFGENNILSISLGRP